MFTKWEIYIYLFLLHISRCEWSERCYLNGSVDRKFPLHNNPHLHFFIVQWLCCFSDFNQNQNWKSVVWFWVMCEFLWKQSTFHIPKTWIFPSDFGSVKFKSKLLFWENMLHLHFYSNCVGRLVLNNDYYDRWKIDTYPLESIKEFEQVSQAWKQFLADLLRKGQRPPPNSFAFLIFSF